MRGLLARLLAMLPRSHKPLRRVYTHRPCEVCGRVIAHSKAGHPWRHICRKAA